ncbi:MAG TPA: GNAT family N-acetyltransferase [Fimbriimonadaceae bacterium]|nr:GNAT family N-acetyltransferase [Fimbriimonadaceae bacterium]HRE92856.1 GNAT family N-acetyltransferase [Fimbriimonadaceae bacterium]HRI74464.1 GNAT family N-acetyltransferase [Fimbriimonadaceae bacterium]
MGCPLEHRVLIERTRANIAAAYLELARPVPGVHVVRDQQPLVVMGPGQPSFANFLMEFDDAEALVRAEAALRTIEVPSTIWAFHTDADRAPDLSGQLREHGFRRMSRLLCMVAEPEATSSESDFTWEPATRPADRDTVAAFMVRQFFGNTDRQAQAGIQLGTSKSVHSLYATPSVSRMTGGVMIVRSEGMGGLYCLCVHPDHQGKGLGGQIVRAVRREVHPDPVMLQCDATLERWYQALGFRTFGHVDAYCRDR